MKRGKKDKVSSLDDHLRYSGNKMSNRERNEFERILQRDPFAAEAAEGFEHVSPEEVSADLDLLADKINYRKKRRILLPATIYRIAASFAVLLAVASLIYVLIRKPETINITIAQNEPVVIVSGEKDSISMPQIAMAAKPEKESKAAIEEAVQRTSEPTETIKFDNLDEVPVKVSEGETKSEIKDKAITPQAATSALSGRVAGVTVVPATYPTEDAKKSRAATEKADVLDFEDDTSFVGLEEVVVVGYGVRRSDINAGAAEEINNYYISASPEYGMESFRNYIEQNIQVPGSVKEGGSEVVVLLLTVDGVGKIKNIKVVRSPGEEFSNEAIRLVKSGPAWNPGTQEGDTITDKVRLRVTFKR